MRSLPLAKEDILLATSILPVYAITAKNVGLIKQFPPAPYSGCFVYFIGSLTKVYNIDRGGRGNDRKQLRTILHYVHYAPLDIAIATVFCVNLEP